MTWDLISEEIRGIKSTLNRRRTEIVVKKLWEFTEGKPTTPLYIEYISSLTKRRIISPDILARMGRYVRQNKTLSSKYDLAVFVGGYIRFDNRIDRKLAIKALASIENKSVQAFFALLISGIRFRSHAIHLRVDEYNRETGVVKNQVKVSAFARKYLDAQYDAAISDGLGPGDPLFYISPQGKPKRKILSRDIAFYNKRVKTQFGIDLYAYCLLFYRTRFNEEDKPIRVHRESNKWKSKQA